MKYSKEQIEKNLTELLEECLSSANQDGAIISLNYDEETELCVITMATSIIEEDDYIGFQGY